MIPYFNIKKHCIMPYFIHKLFVHLKMRTDFIKSSWLALCLKISSSWWGQVGWLPGEENGEEIRKHYLIARPGRSGHQIGRVRSEKAMNECLPNQKQVSQQPSHIKGFLFCYNYSNGVLLWPWAQIIKDLEEDMQTLCLLFWGIRLFQIKISQLSRGVKKELQDHR